MRVLLLNTTAQRGGAAIAASRLMKALQSIFPVFGDCVVCCFMECKLR